MGLLVASIDGAVLEAVAEALTEHLRRLVAEGRSAPPGLLDLARAANLEARNGQERPKPAGSSVSGHDRDVLLPTPAAARRLGVSERTLRRLVAAGQVRSVLVRRARRFRPQDLDDYAASHAA